MNISAYILEYLKQFGTATVPGFGVFSLKNSKAIILLEKLLNIPDASSIQDWECLFRTKKNQYYLVLKNVGKNLDKYDYELVTSKIESNVKIL